ncbi:MAG TPA: bifunctional transaldolase/phosoglucose isomerase [Verrucomicrobiae bacterium]|nr:bifunctional transaldolase/phosoglucose isomerase [Verrucomicrobiae bacterium]
MSNQLQQLLEAGQSVWLDNVRRSMFASGELDRLIERGLRGMTSNPTIFEKAIGAGNDYDEQLRSLISEEKNADSLFWDLAIQDIQSACDAFKGVYASSGGNDGFVSLEVSPLLAHETQGTIAMAKELWARVARPNLMVKIPGTKEGLPAIEECIYEGLNINVTLIFSTEMYEKAARAYVKGLQRRVAENKPIDRIRSVNSVFVSRIDTAVDKLLQERIAKGEKLEGLLGKAGVAGLKMTYQRFKDIFESDEFAALRAKGGTPQRPLWASTSTKNPAYPDLMYVETVVGPETVNTMPPATLDALLDHGTVTPDTVESGIREAQDALKALADAKISLFEVTAALQTEGVSSFCDSFAALLGAIVYKQKLLESGEERVALAMGSAQPHYDAALDSLAKADFLKRLWAHDPTLWSNDPAHQAIIKKSLGWLDIPQHILECVPDVEAFGNDVAQKFEYAVVCGMGGSSLAPDVLAETLGDEGEDEPELLVLDSTSPQQIQELDERIHVGETLFIISSKSGTTTEPNAFYAYFQEKVAKKLGAAVASRNFVAITDAGTKLEAEAKSANFLRCFDNDPTIGGRYSALSYVGVVPAAVAGYDVSLLLDRALGAMHANDRTVDPKQAPGVRFGAALGGLATNGRDKVTIVAHPDVAAFPTWTEQLIAESTGKEGKGIVPVAGEPLGDPSVYGNDRLFVYVGANMPEPEPGVAEKLAALEAAGHPVIRLALNDEYDLGEQFYLWEVAVAAAGSLLGIDAFDQPNVQESKDNTVALLEQFARTGSFDEPKANVEGPHFDVSYLSGSAGISASTPVQALAGLFAQLKPGDYQAITAYIARNPAHEALLTELRCKIRDAHKIATTVGFGPRFLHSTGQLHKGGPDEVVILQITCDDPNDFPIPGMRLGFRTLINAQALGDWQSLDKRRRRGVRVHLRGDVEPALRALLAAVDEALAVRA